MAWNHLSIHPSNGVCNKKKEFVSGKRERWITHHGSSPCAVPWTGYYSVLQFIQRLKHTSPASDLVPTACSQWLERQIFFKPYDPGLLKGPVPAVPAAVGLPLNLYLS